MRREFYYLDLHGVYTPIVASLIERTKYKNIQMISRLIRIKDSDVSLDRTGFFLAEKNQYDHLQGITKSFATGFNAAAKHGLNVDLNGLADYKNNLGFYYEGAAMALAIKDCLTVFINRELLVRQFLSMHPEHKYLIHIGVGWAIAKIPWAKNRLFNKMEPLLRWLTVDGYGFHDTFFNPSKTLRPALPKKFKGDAQNIYMQGVGRALWFVCGSSVQQIRTTINTFPELCRSSLWSGVGLAGSYAGHADPDEKKLQLLRDVSGEYQSHLAQGSAFAATAKTLAGNPGDATEKACRILTGLSAAQLAAICQYHESMLCTDSSSNAYTKWRGLVRHDIEHRKSYA